MADLADIGLMPVSKYRIVDKIRTAIKILSSCESNIYVQDAILTAVAVTG